MQISTKRCFLYLINNIMSYQKINKFTVLYCWMPKASFKHLLFLSYLSCLIYRYLEPLAIALDKEKWSLVQLLMSSSYNGYGTSSLKQVTYLKLSHDFSLYSCSYIFFILHEEQDMLARQLDFFIIYSFIYC